MITPPTAEKTSPDQSAVAIEPGFEVAVHAFWDKNRHLVVLVCVAALLVIIGREGWQYYASAHEQSLRDEYARAVEKPELLATFATANSDHALAGVAYLRLADSKYTAGDFRTASENYQKAGSSLKNSALLGRAKLGAAMSQYYSGDRSAGETALKAVGADVSLLASTRVEADYHLAALAYEAGNSAEVSRLATEVGKIDAANIWAQRTTALLTNKP